MRIAVKTNAVSGNDIRVVFRIPKIKHTIKIAIPLIIGIEKFRINASLDVRRHANNGPTPVKNNSINPIGIFTRLKKGAPTVILSPLTASERTGNIVPQKTAKQIVIKITLFNRKPLSLDVKDSILFSDFK
jgi:hypothetical protein